MQSDLMKFQKNNTYSNATGSMSGPDFIGVGPEKTGTSWIHRQLSAHPDVKCLLSMNYVTFGRRAISLVKIFGRESTIKEAGTENSI